MPISEKSRSAIYQALSPITGEEAVAEMLAQFPARDLDEPITRDYLDARLAGLRVEMHQEINRLLVWVIGAMIALTGVSTTISVALTR